MELPPQPDPQDFVDRQDFLRLVAYGEALKAWKEVCRMILENDKAQ